MLGLPERRDGIGLRHQLLLGLLSAASLAELRPSTVTKQ
jgi:hypothetical protein